jgi:hypothetical protein
MAFIRKIFPPKAENSPSTTLKLVVLSEGYIAGEESQFYADCKTLVREVMKISPLNLFNASQHLLSVYSHFEVSTNAGPSIDIPATPGRSAFDSSLDTATQLLTVDAQKVTALLDTLEFRLFDSDETSVFLAEEVSKGELAATMTGTVIVVLLPSLGTSGGEVEYHPIDDNTYHFIATTQDKLWGQLIVRSIANIMGLIPEYGLEEPGSELPAWNVGLLVQKFYGNMVYSHDSVNNLLYPTSSFYRLVPAAKKNVALNKVAHPEAINVRDTSLPLFPAKPTTIELWEGGAGFRTRIYRSAHDCLMRRRIGDLELPVRELEVPFCKVCMEGLTRKIK